MTRRPPFRLDVFLLGKGAVGGGFVHRPTFTSADPDLTRLRLLGLWQGQGQHAIIELRTDVLLIDLVGQRERVWWLYSE